MQRNASTFYEITLQGRLDESWSEWLENLSISHPDESTTVLSGRLMDQAQLHAVLIKIRDLNLKLVSLTSSE